MFIYKHVAVIGIDGMGNFNKDTDTPNFDRIFENGAVTYEALSLAPTISAENWGGMLLGADPVVHGLTNSIVGEFEYTNKALPSVFTRIREAMGDVYLSSCCNWDPINHGIIEHDIGVTLKTGSNDDEVLDRIMEEIPKKPTFLFVQFDEADGAGHHWGYGTPEHLAQIRKEDVYIGKIYDAYAEEGIIDDTLFLVIADHGGYGHGHGGYADGEKYIFLGASGKDVPKGEIGFAQTKDISAIVLRALGIEVPGTDEMGFSSQVPDGIFSDIKGTHRDLSMKDYSRAHKETPAPDSENGIFSYIPKEKFACGFMFEGNLNDISGNVTVTENGSVKYYNNGINGESGEPGINGYAVTSPLPLGGKMTVAVWIKKDKAHHDDCVIAATSDKDCHTTGFSVIERIQDAIFKVGTEGTDDRSFTAAYPADMDSGVVHFAASYDGIKGEVKIYINFRCVTARPLQERYKNLNMSAPLYIGEDATKEYNKNKKYNTVIDDLFIFNDVLSEEEMAKLQAYYDAL